MLQDITPHQFTNEFKNCNPEPEDYVFLFWEEKLLLKEDGDLLHIPQLRLFQEQSWERKGCCQFLFSIDQKNFFLIHTKEPVHINGWYYMDTQPIRYREPMWKAFACLLGAQLNRWYDGNRFCGRCGHKTVKSKTERALRCHACGRIVYPALAPSVVVGITDGDRLLLTKYAKGIYRRYALVAGYAEFGESLEQTVVREVMEEVGLKVKNIRYYQSQPWPLTDTMLAGYFAEVDGSAKVRLQEEELSEATWFHRDEIPTPDSSLSLTNTMIEHFRKQEKQENL